MRILIVSNIEWDDRNAFGNTISNFFGNWENAEFFSIYSRSSMPHNSICKTYYSVTIKDIVKYFFVPWRIGHAFSFHEAFQEKDTIEEKKTIKKIQQSPLYKFVLLCVDSLFNSKIWINKNYKRFVQEVNPDIVFSFGIGDSFILNNIKYLKQQFNVRKVTFFGDDVVASYKHHGLLNRRRLRSINKLIGLSDRVYGASEELAEEYTGLFKIKIQPLYKGCEFMPIKENGTHCEILYAGNLLYGRFQVLANLADAIAQFNTKAEIKCHLSIYSNTYISKEERNKLEIPSVSSLFPAVPYDEIMTLMNEASIVLHVESFEQEEIEKVRLSFSTKIIDCIQSGAVLMGIGPSETASIKYCERIPGAIVVTNPDCILDKLQEVLKDFDGLKKKAQSIRSFGIKYHSMDSNRKALREDFQELVNK